MAAPTLLTVAINGLLLLQVPKATDSPNVVVAPSVQTPGAPVIDPATGWGLTDIAAVVCAVPQPFVTV